MKKTVFVSVLSIVILVSWIQSRPSEPARPANASASGEKKEEPSMRPAPAVGIRAEPSPAPVDLSRAMRLAPSRQELDHEYKNYKTGELEQALNESKRTMRDRELIAKSNRGSLTEDELVTLLVEMRRQSVLSRILAKNRLERLKERFQ